MTHPAMVTVTSDQMVTMRIQCSQWISTPVELIFLFVGDTYTMEITTPVFTVSRYGVEEGMVNVCKQLNNFLIQLDGVIEMQIPRKM